jgi:hypothetical protein
VTGAYAPAYQSCSRCLPGTLEVAKEVSFVRQVLLNRLTYAFVQKLHAASRRRIEEQCSRRVRLLQREQVPCRYDAFATQCSNFGRVALYFGAQITAALVILAPRPGIWTGTRGGSRRSPAIRKKRRTGKDQCARTSPIAMNLVVSQTRCYLLSRHLQAHCPRSTEVQNAIRKSGLDIIAMSEQCLAFLPSAGTPTSARRSSRSRLPRSTRARFRLSTHRRDRHARIAA